MSMARRRWSGRAVGGGLLVVGLAAGMAVGSWGWLGSRSPGSFDGIAMARVVRDSFESAILVRGDIEGAERTEIDCEVEAIQADGSRSQGPTILELIDDGTSVRKDDVILRFDASNFEELARRQQIEVERAISERRQAEIELEVAEVALAAYQDGEDLEIVQSLQGRIALSWSDQEQARARLAWSEHMKMVGYGSASELASDQILLQRLELDALAAKASYRNHVRFQAPKRIRELEIRVEQARDELEYCELQLQNNIKLLEHDREQIAKCTVRSPHDGMVIHVGALYWGDEFQMRVGASVYQGQPLFYIPEMNRPVAEVSLNQSIASRVQVGMRAEVRIDALPGQVFAGRVELIDQLPTINWRAGWDVLHVRARVSLEEAPMEGIFPSMSASVRIVTSSVEGVLLIPGESLGVDATGPYCLVANELGQVERRTVRSEPADLDRLMVVDGLVEGEWVILDPARFR